MALDLKRMLRAAAAAFNRSMGAWATGNSVVTVTDLLPVPKGLEPWKASEFSMQGE